MTCRRLVGGGALALELFIGAAEAHSQGAGPKVEVAPRNYRYLTILCQFADWTATQLKPNSYYARLMDGNQFPSFRHYWEEVSNGKVTFEGSRIVGWVTLPEARDAYYPQRRQDGSVNYDAPDFDKLLQQCTDLVDAEVDFREVDRVNIALNGVNSISHGTGRPVRLEGEDRFIGVTYLASSLNPATVAHEVGHTLDLPHSGGELGGSSNWDVMSGGWQHPVENDFVGSHTIAYHKDRLGWFPAARRYIAPLPSSTEIDLTRHAQPTASGYLYAAVGTAEDSLWYSAETRKRVGDYELPLPYEGVLIHRVDRRVLTEPAPARLVDDDANGNVVDLGAVWQPGETFTDPERGIEIAVGAAIADGYRVRIRRGWRLRVAIDGPGSVTGDITCATAGSPCDRLYADKTSTAMLSATPSSGGHFMGWTGDCSGTGGCSVAVTRDRTLTATFAPPVVITSAAALPAVNMGATFSATLTASGGVGSPTWSVTNGQLPAGLSLNASTGQISGVPGASGSYAFTVRATAGPLSADQQVSLVVTKPTLAREAVLGQLLGGASLSADETRFLDLLGNNNGRLDVGDVRAWLRDNSLIP